ncbi:MAG: glycosyltransferase family 39 protein, partial [Acidobacteriota bacterium]|nr:glycosyltransferase family 39 protein [Acidobacteriota bacterium]
MNAIIAALAIIIAITVGLTVKGGAGAALLCFAVSVPAAMLIGRVREHRLFLLQIFAAGLLVRVLIGTVIFTLGLQDFFGGDALTYDTLGNALAQWMRGERASVLFLQGQMQAGGGWGMIYVVGVIYVVLGRNMLAVQFFNAVIGAATAPVIFLCAQRIFGNLRTAKLAAFCVAFYPSLVLWSSQGLKDGPVVFLLALAMLATLELGGRFSAKYLAVLVFALGAIITLRFYVFYMLVAAIGGAFLVGMRPQQGMQGLLRQVAIVAALGLSLTYLGVLRTAGSRLQTFGSLEAVQRSRADNAERAESGFGQDVDVSTTGGALSILPIGFVYLLFAPFPWQVANLRQSITIPEMIIWWGSFPLLVLGVWFTLKYRLRHALPILLFTGMLTLAYSLFQGNIGTAYRQRAQLLVFYFIFVAAGAVLLKERQESRRRSSAAAKAAAAEGWRAAQARRRYELWKG